MNRPETSAPLMRQPGIRSIIAGIILFWIGGVGVPLTLFIFFLQGHEDTRFMVPTDRMITVETSGRYYLWDFQKVIFENTAFQQEADSFALSITLVPQDKDVPLEFHADSSFLFETESMSKRSIGYFDLPEAGDYRMIAETDGPQRVISFGRSVLRGFFLTLAASFTVAGVSLLGSIGLIVRGVLLLAGR